jgi:hypothetical protein
MNDNVNFYIIHNNIHKMITFNDITFNNFKDKQIIKK